MSLKVMDNLVLVAGWGLGAEFFEPLLKIYPDAAILERGYFQAAAEVAIPENATVITHSMGLHYLKDSDFTKIKNLVIAGGFLNFHQGPSQKAVRRMISKLKNKANIVLTDFYKGVFFPEPPPFSPPEITNSEALKADLMLLNKSTFDVSQLSGIKKILILAGDEDMITPLVKSEELKAAIPEAELYLGEGWGHGFLYHQAADCAKKIQKILC